MLTLIIWWSGIVLESCILARAFHEKALGRYPFFYLYVASLLLSDGLLYVVSVFNPAAYYRWNWDAGFINILLSSGILLEIFKHVLTPYPGAGRFVRISGLTILGLILSFGALYLIFAPGTSSSGMAHRFERNLLAAQAVFLSMMVGVIFYYGIALGRNLRGMIVGYGLCVATTLITLAVRSFVGSSFNATWVLIQPLAYWASLFVWMVALWNYRPNPAPRAIPVPEYDYDSFVSGTIDRIGEVRSHLGRAARR